MGWATVLARSLMEDDGPLLELQGVLEQGSLGLNLAHTTPTQSPRMQAAIIAHRILSWLQDLGQESCCHTSEPQGGSSGSDIQAPAASEHRTHCKQTHAQGGGLEANNAQTASTQLLPRVRPLFCSPSLMLCKFPSSDRQHKQSHRRTNVGPSPLEAFFFFFLVALQQAPHSLPLTNASLSPLYVPSRACLL